MNRRSAWIASPALWPALGLIALLLFDAARSHDFLRIGLLHGHLSGVPIDILTQGSRTLLLALGMTLVIATGGVDLSVGSLLGLAGMACALALRAGAPLAAGVMLALGVGAAAGSVNGVLVAAVGVQPIVATLIVMVTGRGLAELVSGGKVIVLNSPAFNFLADGYVLGLPFAPLWVLALYALAQAGLRRTAAGLFIEAAGDNETASRFSGLAAGRIKALVYVASGACAGLAGVLTAAATREADPYRAGENMELDAIFAVVVGGTALTGGRFLLIGTVLGALLLQTFTTTLYNLGVPPAVAPVPKALLIIAVALLQSEKWRQWARGLWRRRAAP